VQVARDFEAAGAARLHLVDLDGAKASEPRNLDVLRAIAGGTNLKVEFGGGIKSRESLEAVLEAGASYAICGSIAITQPDIFKGWLESFGERILLGLDLKDGFVATYGWLETSQATAADVLNAFGGMVKQAIVTEISHDGMLQGVDAGFYSALQSQFPDVEIVVSGGVSSEEDIRSLKACGLKSAIVGKAIYEGRVRLDKLFKEYAR
jgi:Phosphoribosylformimino-5-aminoimidazole carboxamide ribonucleotide (ProFAR) isomerase